MKKSRSTYLNITYTSNDSELEEKITKAVGNRFLSDSARIAGMPGSVGFVFKGAATLLKAVDRVLKLKNRLPAGYWFEIKICDI